MPIKGKGTKDNPWILETPPGTSEFKAYDLFMENRSKRFVFRTFLDRDIFYDRENAKVIPASGHSEIDDKDVFNSPTFSSIAPLKVYLDPSYRCNLSCRHCMTSSSPYVDTSVEIPLDRVFELVREVAFSGAMELSIGGGEPLLYPSIFEVLSSARELGLNTVVTTNGTLVTPEIADKLRELNLYEVRVSFEGSRPIHDSVRGQGCYKQALNAVTILTERNLRVLGRITLTSKSDQGLSNLYRDLSSHGVREMKVSVAKDAGRASQNRDLLGYPTDLETAGKLIDMGKKYDMDVKLAYDDFPLLWEEARARKPRSGKCNNCGAGLETVYVSPAGKVCPCSSMTNYPFGDLRNASFMAILKSEVATNYRRLALAHNDASQGRHLCKYFASLGKA